MDEALYDALSKPFDNKFDNRFVHLQHKFHLEDPFRSMVMKKTEVVDGPAVRRIYNSPVGIAYSRMGTSKPLDSNKDGTRVLFLHGVPTRKEQYHGVQKLIGMFADTVSIDMLGMGESDSLSAVSNYTELYKWKYDTVYIRQFCAQIWGSVGKDSEGNDIPKPFVFVADDWGAGIAQWYTVKYGACDLEKVILIDPVAFDGYPVKEIEDIAKLATLNDEEFYRAIGDFPSKLVQTLKSMVYDSSVLNQYNQRTYLQTYVDIDYERDPLKIEYTVDTGTIPDTGEIMMATEYGFTPLTESMKVKRIKDLARRAAVLSPKLLMPYHSEKNPFGLKFSKWTVNTKIIWGANDNMMPETQRHRFRNCITNARVITETIPEAGHLSMLDQPVKVAEAIMDFLACGFECRQRLSDIYLGFSGIQKGDEPLVVRDLGNLYAHMSTCPPSTLHKEKEKKKKKKITATVLRKTDVKTTTETQSLQVADKKPKNNARKEAFFY